MIALFWRAQLMFLKIINFCEKRKKRPQIALATIVVLFYGNLGSDKEVFNYCDNWVKENGEITYDNLRRYIKELGYIKEIVEISTKFDWSSEIL